ncbi:hypothetical protein ACFQ4K_03805 [Tistrella bauzanensis]
MSAHVNSGGEALLGLREAGTRRAALRWQAGTLKLQTDGAAPLVLATQGSDRVAVPADRPAIGIGTNAPAQALHVSTSSLPKLRLQLTGGSARSWDIGQTADGHLEMMDVGVGVAMLRLRSVTDAEGAEVAMIGGHGGISASFFNVAGTGGSAAGCAMSLRANSITGRSLNASGTINASGADFAEYVTKAPGCGPVAKGRWSASTIRAGSPTVLPMPSPSRSNRRPPRWLAGMPGVAMTRHARWSTVLLLPAGCR